MLYTNYATLHKVKFPTKYLVRNVSFISIPKIWHLDYFTYTEECD